MNEATISHARRNRAGSIGIGPLIVVVAVLAGAAIAVVVAVRAAGPGTDKVAAAPGESTPANPLRPSANPQNSSAEKPQAPQPAAANASPDSPPLAPPGEHPLDPAIAMAEKILANLNKNVKDYTAIVAKQERLNGELGEPVFMFTKIRQNPFSVYLNFLKPDDIRGREVLYVAGENDGKLSDREGSGWKRSLGIFSLPPTGPVAMMGNRYPITDLGLTHLTERLLQIAKQDRRYGDVDVHYFKDAKVNDRVCTLIEVTHPVKYQRFLFYKAQIYIDDQLNVPIRYAAYMWPKKEGEEPPLDECYTYLKLKLNVGLTDGDFDLHNPKYHFIDK